MVVVVVMVAEWWLYGGGGGGGGGVPRSLPLRAGLQGGLLRVIGAGDLALVSTPLEACRLSCSKFFFFSELLYSLPSPFLLFSVESEVKGAENVQEKEKERERIFFSSSSRATTTSFSTA